MNPNQNQPKTVADTIERLKNTKMSNIMIILSCILAMMVTLEMVDGIKWLFFSESPISENAQRSKDSLNALEARLDAIKQQEGK